jgi:hypothetical protein
MNFEALSDVFKLAPLPQLKGFEFEIMVDLDNTEEIVEFVTFEMGYYGRRKWELNVIKGRNRVTQLEAVKYVEKWLSKPLTEEYFDMVKDDTKYDDWEKEKNHLKCRGDLLGSRKYLHEIRFDENYPTILHLECDI